MAAKKRGLVRLQVPGHGECLGAASDEDIRVDLSAGRTDLVDVLSEHPTADAFANAVESLYERAETVIEWSAVSPTPSDASAWLLAPVDRQECWGAGCTYRVDDVDSMRRGRPLYAATYEDRRPMLFFKGTAERTAGPGQPIACRRGSQQTIPEAELAVLLGPAGEPLAYALGNDVTALDLELDNPLYQPQAKIFDGSSALGPWWTPAAMVPNAPTTPFTCKVVRDERTVLQQQIDPSRMVRSIEQLAEWLYQSTSFPLGAVLMTGGGAAVPEGFALCDGDVVEIAHPDLGELRNPVTNIELKGVSADGPRDLNYAG